MHVAAHFGQDQVVDCLLRHAESAAAAAAAAAAAGVFVGGAGGGSGAVGRRGGADQPFGARGVQQSHRVAGGSPSALAAVEDRVGRTALHVWGYRREPRAGPGFRRLAAAGPRGPDRAYGRTPAHSCAAAGGGPAQILLLIQVPLRRPPSIPFPVPSPLPYPCPRPLPFPLLPYSALGPGALPLLPGRCRLAAVVLRSSYWSAVPATPQLILTATCGERGLGPLAT